MSEPTIGEAGAEVTPVYDVLARKQEDGNWSLLADLPGGELTHEVRTLEDLDWVAQEMKTVIAAHLGVSDNNFVVHITAPD